MRLGAAVAYLVKNRLIMHAWLMSRRGDPHFMNGPIALIKELSPSKVGTDLMWVLSGSRRVDRFPDYSEGDRQFEVIFKFAGIKSWGKFYREAKVVRIDRYEDRIEFIPTVYDYFTKEHPEIDDEKLTSSLDEEAMGKALLNAFAVIDEYQE